MGNIQTDEITVGVVGLGLMGTSFIASLLAAGHEVKAVAPVPDDMEAAPDRIKCHLIACEKAGLLQKPVDSYLRQLVITEDYSELKTCQLVVECVIEKAEIKRSIYEKTERVVGRDTVIASNTSAIPISELQKGLVNPGRFLGIHWAEPSYFTRFLEITNGERTALHYSEWVYELAHYWGKEPTLLRKDVRGFITNRLMYAAYREGLSIVSKGEATLEDVDKAFRYDAGSWMTLMGVFRRMDYLGIKDHLEMFRRILPDLCNDEYVPALMQKMVDKNARGVQSLSGLYEYTAEEAEKWNEAFALFNVDIFQLAALYPSSVTA
ncbi:MAG TPA: 3-hydroxyacyl-CoA dehydrogenase family protein [Puia sp.]|jgi:3-hydroxybutyryl-CoA dehydrogenase